jgi:conjugative transfer signal peptidase TraF
MTLTGLSAQLRATNKCKAKRLAVTTAALFIGAFIIGGTAGVGFNASPSLPIGLYVRTENLAEPLVEFCPPEPYASLAIRRGYRTKGSCPDGATPLLKPVIATEGDIVAVSEAGISVNGYLMPNTRPRAVDTAGRPMPMWPTKNQRVQPGTIWVASNFSPRSFDSRSFGPISISSIRSRLRPLITE